MVSNFKAATLTARSEVYLFLLPMMASLCLLSLKTGVFSAAILLNTFNFANLLNFEF